MMNFSNFFGIMLEQTGILLERGENAHAVFLLQKAA